MFGLRTVGLVRSLLKLATLSLLAVLVIAPGAFAQGAFCTTSVAAEGENVTKCDRRGGQRREH
jgi:hypothetical protein